MPPRTHQFPEADGLATALNILAALIYDMIKARQGLHDSLLMQPDPWLGKRRRDFDTAFGNENRRLHDLAGNAQKLASQILSQRDAAVADLAKTAGKP